MGPCWAIEAVSLDGRGGNWWGKGSLPSLTVFQILLTVEIMQHQERLWQRESSISTLQARSLHTAHLRIPSSDDPVSLSYLKWCHLRQARGLQRFQHALLLLFCINRKTPGFIPLTWPLSLPGRRHTLVPVPTNSPRTASHSSDCHSSHSSHCSSGPRTRARGRSSANKRDISAWV